MYLHCLRTDSHFLLFALVLVSAVVAAAAPGIRPVQQRHSLTSTSYIPKVTLASVKFPGTETETDIKSKNGLHIEAAIKRFLRKVIKSQFELGDLKDNFKFYGSPSKPDIEGRYHFDVILSLNPPTSDWKGKAAVRFTNKVLQKTRIWGTLNDTSGDRIAEISDNVFNNALFTQGRPMDVNLYTLAKLEGGKKRTIS
ncbi:hypothetical protein F5879DRAFT_918294 [Lentinula edodes]|uniref:uncharacterized protein n=1 Tax=Lentinula edodes TaxID=5353 RepID=UPI001E8DDD80|nr:uncharacterized protein C8R40DRAFT_1065730 [Lentinula edodes]KAH7880774.1 hypothetical protein C8R40DRAFT_1065730 [Lentinula edodes]KAJ3909514.1 hypothetical protein F5879DRAFT_918294 [Lentinula edodes]KAJ3917301.1 hypothetical protein F5877DRAFT_68355 [Lentinula edodes]